MDPCKSLYVLKDSKGFMRPYGSLFVVMRSYGF